MVNANNQSTKTLTQLLQQMKKIQTIMAHVHTQLNETNKNGGNDNNTSGGKKSNKVLF